MSLSLVYWKGGDMARALPQGFRRKANGSIEYRFMIGDQRFSVSGSTVRECREKERIKAAKVAAGQYTRNERITIRQYFEEWMKAREGTVTASSLHTVKTEMKPVLDLIGAERVAKVERRQIIALQRDLQKSFTTTGTNYRVGILKSMFKAAVLDGVIARNPCEGVKSLKRTEVSARDTIHRALTLEEQEAFFRAAEGEWLYELLCFLIQTGCRVGEALALRWSDIDQRKNVIRVRRTIVATDRGTEISDRTKSRAGMRDIPLTEDILETLRRQRQKVRDVFGEKVERIDGLVFIGITGKGCCQKQTVHLAIKRTAKRAGIDHISTHCLRDTFATRAIEGGMNPQTLKTILGHESFSMTMDLYAHVLPNIRQEEMNRIKISI